MAFDRRHREDASIPHVLVVGSANNREFADALQRIDSSAHARLLCNGQAARDCIESASSSPDLVILLRNRPDGMTLRDANELSSLAPESRFVWLLGSWCEGEAHTGKMWDGLEKVYWHTFRRWWDRYQCEFFGHNGLPETNKNHLAVVHTECVLTFEAIADALAVANCSAVWQHPHCRAPLVSGAAVGIWDGGQLLPHEEESLLRFCQSLGNRVPVVALLDFPQYDRILHARKLGAIEVLGKPWRENDLIAACGLAGSDCDLAGSVDHTTTIPETRAKPQAA